MSQPYEPSRDILQKITRKFVRYQARRNVAFTLDYPLVSFSFDDFPKSAMDVGAAELEKRGWRGTFYVASGLLGQTNHHGLQASAEDLLELDRRGHEIAGHTYSHMDLAKADEATALADIERNIAALKEIGITQSIDSFAYPFGETSKQIKTALEARFQTLRGIGRHPNRGQMDFNGLLSMPLYSGPNVDAVMAALEGLKDRPGWLIIFTHEITQTPGQWGCTPDDFAQVCDLTETIGARVETVRDAAKLLVETQDD